MTNTNRLALDALLLAAVLTAANPSITGDSLHIWIGLALLAAALVHLALNMDWVVRVIDGLFDRIRTASRVNLVIDTALFTSLVAVSLSGAMLLPALAALTPGMSAVWSALHVSASSALVALTLLHLAMHARWIAGVIQRECFDPKGTH